MSPRFPRIFRWLTLAAFALAGTTLAPATVTAAPAAPTLLVLGDSISAGLGLASNEGWVALLARKLAQDGYPQRVINASISGDTTAGGRARLPALLREHHPFVVIIELGGNDALRGGDLRATRANLEAIVEAVQAAHARPLILGMQVPPNYGPAYASAFEQVYADVAKARKVPLVPWLFKGFGEDLAQFQPDRIHPIAAAQPKILANVWPALRPLLKGR
ncbi:MAG TPA: arylesterase [Casimicrobiaceae bacterium]|nr:arylesterase [Casimicrobiaceae bacterium]